MSEYFKNQTLIFTHVTNQHYIIVPLRSHSKQAQNIFWRVFGYEICHTKLECYVCVEMSNKFYNYIGATRLVEQIAREKILWQKILSRTVH